MLGSLEIRDSEECYLIFHVSGADPVFMLVKRMLGLSVPALLYLLSYLIWSTVLCWAGPGWISQFETSKQRMETHRRSRADHGTRCGKKSLFVTSLYLMMRVWCGQCVESVRRCLNTSCKSCRVLLEHTELHRVVYWIMLIIREMILSHTMMILMMRWNSLFWS